MFRLARTVRRERGFDVIHGCNPPDLIWLLALRWRLSGVRYLFDHHDVCPELFEAKFGKKGLLYRIMLLWERLTFATASVSIATNDSFREIAIRRGRMDPDDVFVVRSAPRIEKFELRPPVPALKKGARTLIGYVGVIGQQEGMDLLVEAADILIRQLGHATCISPSWASARICPRCSAMSPPAGSTPGSPSPARFMARICCAVLNTADIGVAPDPKNPMNDISTMNKIMEYMTLEKPSVQFDLKEGRTSAGGGLALCPRQRPRRFRREDRLADRPPRRGPPHGQARARARPRKPVLGPLGAASAGGL